ncbi:hypothetical protein N658DRAFT_472521 [Parathielavia hyrcaniae]|uniref:Uncharacterized protein n=1 Tax=Parathielavia hyrcaniae TaxID=113614 RepID=A0AAN6T1T3_9PEZI|nr:hypothetical protein N658DRAFT_472521 [Parathielavia hyrcaniae]
MGGPNPFISDGTCYSSRGERAKHNFLPCGNAAYGHLHCCQAGDICLEDNACYNFRHGTTYLAGCTDFDYEDPSCPDKKAYMDYPWAGLIYCKPNRWVACEEADKPSTITVGDECTCPPDSETITVAFTAAASIPAIASLPTTQSGTIEWFAGHVPTTTPHPTASSSSSETAEPSSTITSSANLTSPANTSASDSSSSLPQSHGLSDSVQAGIGVGAAVGTILLLGALSALWVVLRRRRRNDENGAEAGQAASAVPTQSDKTPGSDPGSGAVPAEMATPEVPPRPSASELPIGPWVVRPELQGDPSPARHNQAAPPSRSVSPPGTTGSLASSSLVSPMSPGWQVWSQGSGVAVAMAPLSPDAEGVELDYQQGIHSKGQHQGWPAPNSEGLKPSHEVVVELPA